MPPRRCADPAEAVRHATLATTRSRDPDALARALRTSGRQLLVPAQQARLRDALERSPGPSVTRDPALLVLESMLCRLTLRYDEAAQLAATRSTRWTACRRRTATPRCRTRSR